MPHSDLIYENETASVVQLQGKETERGIYECRWKNSKGEQRHRNFTVGISFEKNRNIIIISASLFGLLAVGVGIGIKVYLNKVKDFLLILIMKHFIIINSNNLKEKRGKTI